MEINRRMSTRFTWLLGSLVLVFIALLMACGSNFSPQSDGLLIVPSQGGAVMQVFSFNLSGGSTSEISTTPAIQGPPNQGSPTQVVLDPAGLNAYVVYSVACTGTNLSGAVLGAISSYSVANDGTLIPNGNVQYLDGNAAYPGVSSPFPQQITCGTGTGSITTSSSGNAPTSISMDSTGKFLFVASQLSNISSGTTSAALPGTVSVFAVGSGAALTEVPGSPFSLPLIPGQTNSITSDPFGLAVSPTAFPAANAPCSAQPAPTQEFLYVSDSNNNRVFVMAVNSTGVLDIADGLSFPTGTTPGGVAVDPCNRFLYVTNQASNNVSAYTICSQASTICQSTNGSLIEVSGSPVAAGNTPIVAAVDPSGNFLYVVNTLSQQISGYRISQASGKLTPLSPATVATGNTPVSIAIRADDEWLFVTNNGSTSGNGSVSEFTITPATGTLTPAGTGILTDTFPSGTAVK
jgi:6-phosphogluconolactonase (cycloisomerase 2 family)